MKKKILRQVLRVLTFLSLVPLLIVMVGTVIVLPDLIGGWTYLAVALFGAVLGVQSVMVADMFAKLDRMFLPKV